MKEITLEELNNLSKDSYLLLDIRDEGVRTYGMMPGAIGADLDDEDQKSSRQVSDSSFIAAAPPAASFTGNGSGCRLSYP